MNLRPAWSPIKFFVDEWRKDNVPRLSAAIAFYTVLSLAPLLLLVIAVAGRIFGPDAVRGEIVAQFGSLLGREAAEQIETVIRNAYNPSKSLVASILGSSMLLLGATGAISELKGALNTVWNVVPPKRKKIVGMLRERLISLVIVLGVAFLLLVSLILSAALSALAQWASLFVPDADLKTVQLVNALVSFVVITMLFAMIYKVLPDVRIAWRDVWVGSAVTSLLFNIGKYLIGVYIGRSSLGSVYGAAGSIVVILVWVYYSASIFLLGAEFTEFYASRWGSRIRSIGFLREEGASPAQASE